MKDLQWFRLRRLLAHAYETVPFYRDRFDALGLTPRDIRSPEDFARLPALTKQELRSQRIRLLSSTHPRRASIVTTSGSSGDPVSVLRDRISTAYHRAAKLRGHRWFGIDIGDREARIWGVPADVRARIRERIKDILMNRIRWSAYQLDPNALRTFYAQIQRFRPNYLYGYTTCLHDFSRFVLSEGLDTIAWRLKAAIVTSETLSLDAREKIEEALHCRVVNEYGCTETGIIAFECPAGQMHIAAEAQYVEVEQKPEASSNGPGEIIVTDLHNYSMPIIRYRLGDVVRLGDHSCSCGRGLPLVKDISGRISDIIVTPDGRRVETLLFYYVLCDLQTRGGGIKKLQVVRKARADYVIRLVRDENYRESDLEFVKGHVRQRLGGEVRIQYESVPYIDDRTQAGKLRHYVDEVLD